MNLATATQNGRDVALTTLADNVRAVSSIMQDAVASYDVRALRDFRNRVSNVRAITSDIRRATESVEKVWHSLPAEEKRELYALALMSTRRLEQDASGSDAPLLSLKGLYIKVFARPLLRIIEDAEDAVFWFADEIFDQVESEAPDVQATICARLETTRTEANPGEHGLVDTSGRH